MRIMILVLLFVSAVITESKAEDQYFGFTLAGKVINPLCLEHIHPWLSDSTIIVKSLILDYCQDSNWAYEDNPTTVDGNVVSTKVKGAIDSEVTSSIFSYEIVGKTDNGLFIAVLPQNSEVAAYRIDEQTIKSELFNPQPEKVHILTQVSLSLVLCMNKVWVKGNKVFVEHNVVDENAARPDMCTAKLQTDSYDVSP